MDERIDRSVAIAQLSSRAYRPSEMARRLAQAGVPVFPCLPEQKRPMLPSGIYGASSNASLVNRWWARWPDANVAIPTGQASGVTVVDVGIDGGNDRGGFAAYQQAREAGLLSNWSMLVRTPSKGLHLYFPSPDGAQQPSWASPNGDVSFLGEGGYVLLPPSRVTGPDGVAVGYRFESHARTLVDPVDAEALRAVVDPEHARDLSAPTSRRQVAASMVIAENPLTGTETRALPGSRREPAVAGRVIA